MFRIGFKAYIKIFKKFQTIPFEINGMFNNDLNVDSNNREVI